MGKDQTIRVIRKFIILGEVPYGLERCKISPAYPGLGKDPCNRNLRRANHLSYGKRMRKRIHDLKEKN